MDPHSTESPVGVLGTGTMGAGIAQVAVLAGRPVLLYDAVEGAAERAVSAIGERLDRLVAKARLSSADADSARKRLTVVRSLSDLASCGLVIEAAAEDLAIKRALFESLESVVAEGTVLASNTSTLSITAIAAGLAHPERVCGLHFFNPAPVMKLVEVVSGEATSTSVASEVAATATAWGKTPVQCTSTPGFVVNRVARPFYGEAMRVLEARGADCATIDAVFREAGGFPMGPFELADLVGNDVNLAVARSVWEQTFHDPRYAPVGVQQRLVDAGRLGKKAGGGWYASSSSSSSDTPSTEESRSVPDRLIYHGGFRVGYALLDRISAAGVTLERNLTGPERHRTTAEGLAYGLELPSGGLVLETVGEPATVDGDAVALDWVHDARTATRVCLAPSDTCSPSTLDEAVGAFQAAGLAVSVIDDVPGLLVARTVSMLVNEAVELVARGEASAADVDLAMRLGTGYPLGPLEWGDRIGPDLVADVLLALEHAYPSGRYRPAPRLIRAAHTGGGLSSASDRVEDA